MHIYGVYAFSTAYIISARGTFWQFPEHKYSNSKPTYQNLQ